MSNPDRNGKDTPAFVRERAEMTALLRKRDRIRDERVLAAMEKIPRHLFVLDAMRGHAYGDHALPIDFGQTISQPYIVARQTELLEVTKNDRVLEIGAGSGYQTAVLAQVAGQVFALERLPELARRAQELLRELRINNATIKCFDGTYGWNEFAPYRGILVAAGSPEIPKPLVDQLAVGGHLVIPIGTEKEQRLIRVTRTEDGAKTEDFGACQFVKLIGKYGWES
ncbi:MAG TPA: protein-L-isoaspartate(D-aspartate) O-methyltransferase [Blastocatellia bacterium]|nr:protein-L-isoaspartate(D-aspartate) O-methyltransferase [Blastocatellia bacterium]HMX24882.1 protein-L-isoaspartate(D-aspartate) O-methyltransferase [Blastocatellia bacterium]HMY71667.1 protein-L-isoaspartate(D-aspartate) O-methyltransferase [Blastocatellia bacterium]HMZ20018.1 protein-L-isoaspartate(D-aspartate) O-methyltransferase [Blastocatellia bacterium]HNG32816.1 protein-L-isoaspartate(D-aspartate) O-methyltransferase [Blastocatellia bacterium]